MSDPIWLKAAKVGDNVVCIKSVEGCPMADRSFLDVVRLPVEGEVCEITLIGSAPNYIYDGCQVYFGFKGYGDCYSAKFFKPLRCTRSVMDMLLSIPSSVVRDGSKEVVL